VYDFARLLLHLGRHARRLEDVLEQEDCEAVFHVWPNASSSQRIVSGSWARINRLPMLTNFFQDISTIASKNCGNDIL